MALHARQAFRGRARLLIRETAKDLAAMLAHDVRNPTNKYFATSDLVSVNYVVNLMPVLLARTVQR